MNHGDELNALQVKNEPVEVLWAADQNEFYTIMLVGMINRSIIQYAIKIITTVNCSFCIRRSGCTKTHNTRGTLVETLDCGQHTGK